MLRAISDQMAERVTLLEEDSANLVTARLRRSSYPFLRGIKCEVRDGVTVLSGEVPTFHLKQLAQELAAHTKGVHQVENRLHVRNATYQGGRSAVAG
jgi:osmotically-inducible protein OsmY